MGYPCPQGACPSVSAFTQARSNIILGQDYWTRTRPVYPLLEHLAKGHDYARYLLLTDSREHIIRALVDFDRELEARDAR
jgi:hypothetical protein